MDYIYVVADGRLAEQGTYPDLISQDGEFSKFIAEFGSSKEENENAIEASAKADAEEELKKMEKMKTAVAGNALMQVEERNTGSISWKVYKTYFKAGKGQIVLPILLFSMVLLQGTIILSSYWFVDYSTIVTTFD